MTYEETLKRIQAQYDSAITATLAVISKTKPLTKKKLTEQLLRANKAYWAARLAELDEVFVTEAEQASAALSALYLAEADTFSKRIRSIYANYEKSFNIPQSVARELLKNATYDRSVADTIKATVREFPDGEEKERMLAELSAPAYRYRMQRVEQLTRQAEETCSDIAKAEINTDRVFLQTQTEKAYNITVEGLSEPTPAQRVLEKLDPVQEFTPTTDKGIFDSFSLTPTETVREIVATDWSGRSFSDRVWHNTDEVARSIKEVLVKGELTGASEAEMAAQVAERFNVGMYAARRIVRTESNYCTNQAELKGYIAAGYEKYEYAALIDDRTSDICKDLDGKIFDIKDAVVGVNYPPMHPFCRSSVYPVIETAEDVQRDIDEMIDSWNVPEGMSLDEFIDRVNNGELEQIREEQATAEETAQEQLTIAENGDIIKLEESERPENEPEVLKQFDRYDVSSRTDVEKLAQINPNYVAGRDGEWENNCQRCVIAYELVERGYDVTAKPFDVNDPVGSKMFTLIENASDLKYFNANHKGLSTQNYAQDAQEAFSRWGDNARAVVSVSWKGGEGHVFIAKKVGDEIVYLDPQSNKIRDMSATMSMVDDKVHSYMFRIDNAEFTDLVGYAVQNRR